MTEPVAYMLSDFVGNDFTSLELPKNPNNPRGLYFKEQLHPRVKMTQAEFDEWSELYQSNTLFSSAMSLLDDDKYVEKYNNLYMNIYTGEDAQNIYNEAVFAELWAEYNPDHPEETIEIAPDMKWFVRSKEKYAPDMDQGISESGYLYLTQGDIYSIEYYDITTFKDEAQQFDTKEEAEKWTNPQTEAVHLPVKGE